MNNININENNLKNISILSDYSHKRYHSPPKFDVRMSYNSNYLNDKINSNNFRKSYINTTSQKNQTFRPFFKTANNFYPKPSQSTNFTENRPKYFQDISRNNEEDIIIKEMKNLINQREQLKVQKLLDQYYTHNYKETINNNIDTAPNGINLSISNCQTQYPINKLNDDNFYQRMKYLLEDYEDKKHNINKMIKSNTLYHFDTSILNTTKKEKFSSRDRIINPQIGGIINTVRRIKNNSNNNYYNRKGKKYNLNNNLTYYNLHHKKIKSQNLNNFNLRLNDDELNEKEDNEYNEYNDYNPYEDNNNDSDDMQENDSSMNLEENNFFIHKLMKINNKRMENKPFKRFSLYKNAKRNIIGKNLSKEYEVQEKYVSNIKTFIECLERCYILSFSKFYKYFIKQLKLYNKSKFKYTDSINLLKRFQKSKKKISNKNINNINNLSNGSLSTYRNYYRSSNNIFNTINSINFIENYKNKNMQKTYKSPNVYIPKNSKNYMTIINNKSSNNTIHNTNFSIGKTKSFKLYSNISNNSKNINNRYNLSTDYNTKKCGSSDKKAVIIKSRNDFSNYSKYNTNVNNFNNMKNNKSKNDLNKAILSPNISSFSKKSKENLLTDYNNFNEKTISNQKTIIYIKPKAGNSNLNKKLLSKERHTNNKEDINNSNINKKDFKKMPDYIYLDFSNKNNNNYTINTSMRSPKKKNFTFKNHIYENNKNIINNKRIKNGENNENKNLLEKIIIKDICSYDKKLWVTVKYMLSQNSLQNFNKIKIRKKLIKTNDTKNIFINNELYLLKPSHTETIELISPIILLNAYIENNNNNNDNNNNILENKESDILLKENELHIFNDKNKIIKMMNILQNFEKHYNLYFYNYFFDQLKNDINQLSLRQKKIFKNIKNNFENNDDIDISNIYNNNNNNKNNDCEFEEESNTDNEKNNSKNKKIYKNNNNNNNKSHLKRRLFPYINIQRLISEDNVSFDKKVKFNRSILDENNTFDDDKKFLNFSEAYDAPSQYRQYRSLRPKITKNKIYKEKISNNIDKKDNIKEELEIKKKNKIKFLITDKFSYQNNCLRIIKNYFYIWKIKFKDNKNNNNNNIKKINLNEYSKKKGNIFEYNTNINEKTDNNYLNIKNQENDIEEEEDEYVENYYINYNGDKFNLNNIKEGKIKLKKDIFMLPLNSLIKLKNEKRIEINSIRDSSDYRSKDFTNTIDKNEIEEKIDYFRIYLINYIFKMRNYSNSEEENEY